MNDDDFNKIGIPKSAYETESLDKEIERIIIAEGYFPESNYQLAMKPKFSTTGSIIEKSPKRGIQISFVQNVSIRDLFGFKSGVIYEEKNYQITSLT